MLHSLLLEDLQFLPVIMNTIFELSWLSIASLNLVLPHWLKVINARAILTPVNQLQSWKKIVGCPHALINLSCPLPLPLINVDMVAFDNASAVVQHCFGERGTIL